MSDVMQCPCGGTPQVTDIALGGIGGPYSIHCPRCYDGGERCSTGDDMDECVWWWNDMVMEELEASHVSA